MFYVRKTFTVPISSQARLRWCWILTLCWCIHNFELYQDDVIMWMLNHVFCLQPRIDDKQSRWLHLRIRPSALPFLDPVKSSAYGKVKTKALVDGRWTLAFRDEESCKSALSMVLEETKLQSNEVERSLKPLFDLEKDVESSKSSVRPNEASSSYITPSNSF